MLYISILLSVWFVLWLVFAVFVKDTGHLFSIWLKDMYDEDTDEDTSELLEKSDDGIYHLSCPHCSYTWWSIEPNVNYCPNCGKNQKGE